MRFSPEIGHEEGGGGDVVVDGDVVETVPDAAVVVQAAGFVAPEEEEERGEEEEQSHETRAHSMGIFRHIDERGMTKDRQREIEGKRKERRSSPLQNILPPTRARQKPNHRQSFGGCVKVRHHHFVLERGALASPGCKHQRPHVMGNISTWRGFLQRRTSF